MKKNFTKKVLLFIFLLSTFASYAQVQETWAYSHIAQLYDQYVDANGNIYQTGLAYSEAHQSEGYLTIKHDKNGTEIWRHFQPGIEHFSYIAVDGSGNVYVVGYTGHESYHTGHLAYDAYIFIMKLNANGIFQWSNTFWEVEGSVNYAVYGRPYGLAVDPDGTPYITGLLFTAFTDVNTQFPEHPDSATADIVTIKYDAATGNRQWVRTYNGSNPGQGFDEGRALAIDAFGYIYVSGSSQLNGYTDIATIKYDPSGNIMWSQRFSNTDASLKNDYASQRGLIIDPIGNVIVGGSSKAGFDHEGGDGGGKKIVIKYTFSGFQQWVKEKNLRFWSNGPLIADYANNIIESSDYSTVKYSPTGTVLWESESVFSDLAVDAENNIYGIGACVGTDVNDCDGGRLYGINTVKFSASGLPFYGSKPIPGRWKPDS